MKRLFLKILGAILIVPLIVLVFKPPERSEDCDYRICRPFSQDRICEFDVIEEADSLTFHYARNKVIPERYRYQVLAALSFYPKLTDVRISFISRRLRTSMAARPTPGSVFTPWNRHYHVYFDDVSESNVDFRKASFEAQVGCIIHELAHITRYEGQNGYQLIRDGFRYVTSQRFRSRYEKGTDHIVAEVGGIYYNYLMSAFISRASAADADYLEFKKSVYYSPDDLWELHLKYTDDRLKQRIKGERGPCEDLP